MPDDVFSGEAFGEWLRSIAARLHRIEQDYAVNEAATGNGSER